MFIPNSPRPPRGITCNFRSDMGYRFRVLEVGPTSNTRSFPSVYWLLRVGGPQWIRPREAGGYRGRGRIAGRVAKPAGTDLLPGAAVYKDVVDHIVGPA